MKFRWLIIFFSAVIFQITLHANVCVIKGDPLQWETDYCRVKHNIADQNAREVRECLKEEDEKIRVVSCEGNIVYKTEICEILIDRKKYDGDSESCIADTLDIESYIGEW